jgi:hypothetical protein
MDAFPDDLEGFLGIPPAKDPHRKPQHMMWHLSQGNINSAAIAKLVTKVTALLGISGTKQAKGGGQLHLLASLPVEVQGLGLSH